MLRRKAWGFKSLYPYQRPVPPTARNVAISSDVALWPMAKNFAIVVERT